MTSLSQGSLPSFKRGLLSSEIFGASAHETELGSRARHNDASQSLPVSTTFNVNDINVISEKNLVDSKIQGSYEQSVAQSCDEDFSDLDDLEFWTEEGEDLEGCLIIRIVGNFLPAKVINKERLRCYIFQRVHEIIETGEDFSIVYIHTGVSGDENSPGVVWLKETHSLLPSVCKSRLKKIYVLHPALRMRVSLWAMGSWLGDGTYEKIEFISRVEFLWDYMKKSQVDVPDFVLEHDQDLEARPLMDYGFEVDPLTIGENMSKYYVPLD